MSKPDPTRLDLTQRDGLPDALRVLLADYPRAGWERHRNFDGLTRFWLERHLMFRQVLDRWQAETRGFLDRTADPRRHAAQTAELGGFLINQLHGHHQIEDAHYFPALSTAEPRLARGFGLLDTDHQSLDGELAALADTANTHLQALTDTVKGSADPRASAGAVLARLDGFAPFLNRHLIDEEELVVPVILHHRLRF